MQHKTPKRDYEVGRGKPPAHTRFKPGQSGNPRGRHKGSKNLATLLEEELNQRVTITENGRRVAVTKRELIVKQAVNKAAAGDARMLILLQRQSGFGSAELVSGDADTVFGGEEDEAMLLEFLLRSKEEAS